MSRRSDRPPGRRRWVAGIAAIALVAGALGVAAPARADVVFTVPGAFASLSDAIAAANASSDAVVSVSVTASFAEPGPAITPIARSMQILGNDFTIDLTGVSDIDGLRIAPPPGASVLVERLGLVGAQGHALTVGPLVGGDLALDDVELGGSGSSAIVVDALDGTTMRMEGGSVTDVVDGSGIVAGSVTGGAAIEILDTVLQRIGSSGGSNAGIRVADLADSALTISGVRILDSDAMGINVDARGGAEIEVRDLLVDDVRHVALRASLSDEAHLELSRATIARSGKQYVTGIVLDDAASFVADELWVTGSLLGGVAINAPGSAAGASAIVRRATIEDSERAGVTAILAGSMTLELENTTITGNHGDTNGSSVVSGLVVAAGGPAVEVDVRSSTLVDNVGGPDLFVAGAGSIRVADSIVGRTDAYKVVPTTPSLVVSPAMGPLPAVEVQHTLVGTWNAHADAAVTSGTGNRFDPLVELGTGLATETAEVGYGIASRLDLGRPWTIFRPQPGSPAIDAGDPLAVAPATDQRGGARRVGAASDLGAVEAPPPVPTDAGPIEASPPIAPTATPAPVATVREHLVSVVAASPLIHARRVSRVTSLDVLRPQAASGLAILAAALLGLAAIGAAAHGIARSRPARATIRLPR